MPFHPIEALGAEHRLIEHLVDILDACSQSVEQGTPAAPSTLHSFADAARTLIDRLHHTKEEIFLFTAMAKQGMALRHGLLAAVISEHEDERRLADDLRTLSRHATSTPLERERVIETLCAYTDHVRGHIFTEDTMVYPMAVRNLPSDVLREVGQSMLDYHEKLTQDGVIDELLSAMAQLSALYGIESDYRAYRLAWAGEDVVCRAIDSP